jgi:hypothetical protein
MTRVRRKTHLRTNQVLQAPGPIALPHLNDDGRRRYVETRCNRHQSSKEMTAGHAGSCTTVYRGGQASS